MFCLHCQHTPWPNDDVVDIETVSNHVMENLIAISTEPFKKLANRFLAFYTLPQPSEFRPESPHSPSQKDNGADQCNGKKSRRWLGVRVVAIPLKQG